MIERKKPLGQILKDMRLIKESQIQDALQIQKQKGGKIGQILIQLSYVTEEQIQIALGAQLGMELINLDNLEIPPQVIAMVPASIAKVYSIIPIKIERNVLTVAMTNSVHINVLDDIRFMVNCEVKGSISTEVSVKKALAKYYPENSGDFRNIFNEIKGLVPEQIDEDAKDIELIAEQTPVKKLLNLIVMHAIKGRAADIHFEPFEKEFKVRYRVDGVLYEMSPPPLSLASALISRLKVMSNLNIAETRLPQDGRILFNINGKAVDIRVSTLPTMFGESVVLRILDKSIIPLDIDHLGLRPDENRVLQNLLNMPNGIIIVTGPTGSGKTTTLYSALNYLNDIKWKIITTEDPVEYDLPGIIQCPIKEEIGVTYAECLRSILRQDPDIILLGEIRDGETARMAVEASLTGHLVLTTLHTNDAPSSITRLLDLGIEPFLITATLEAIVAQRLIRRICPNCKSDYAPTPELLAELNLTPGDIQDKKFYYGKGCSQCNNIGYFGRTGIFEVMLATDTIKQLINEHASTEKIRMVAREEGMKTLRESGLLAIYDGLTTIEEVVRETLFT